MGEAVATKRLRFRRSVSQRRAYRDCGEAWRLKYVDNWEESRGHGYFEIGKVHQQVVNEVLTGKITVEQAQDRFTELWAPLEARKDIEWSTKFPWKTLNDRYRALHDAKNPKGIRQVAEWLTIPEWGFLDREVTWEMAEGVEELAFPDVWGHLNIKGLVQAADQGPSGDFEGPAVVDFKTAGQKYDALEAELDEQLTDYHLGIDRAYGLLDRDHNRTAPTYVKWLALCIAVHVSAPYFQWVIVPARTDEMLTRHRDDAVIVDQQIMAGQFARNPKACTNMGGCWAQPLCFPSQQARIATELRKRAQRSGR